MVNMLQAREIKQAAAAAAAALRREYRQVYLAQPDRGGARVIHPPRKTKA